MAEVWKFKVEPGQGSYVQMPIGARILDVGISGTAVCVWALVDPGVEYESRHLGWFATGAPIPDGWSYVGTAHVIASPPGGSIYVWHVFEHSKEGEGE